MKAINRFLKVTTAMVLLFSTISLLAQEENKVPKYITVMTTHWNMDYENFDLDTWKSVEKEYLEKVTMKNEYILGSSFYLHRYTDDSSELLYVQMFASWDAIDKYEKRNGELMSDASWSDDGSNIPFLKRKRSYYNDLQHADEIYEVGSGAKPFIESPTHDMICYVRKSHYAPVENWIQNEYKDLRNENIEIIKMNEYIKGYFTYIHSWGADRSEYIEVFFLDSMGDIEKMFDRNTALLKEEYPNDKALKERNKKLGKYFTGVHGDFIYTFVAGLDKPVKK